MNFAWPQLLWLLVLPAAWLAWELTHRRRARVHAQPKILRAEAGPRSLELAPAGAPAAARARPRAWLAAGLELALLALARPQWGRIEEPVFDQAREILLAVDLSRSMLAPDVKPSRLARAKLLIESLLERLAGERVGLVVFSGTAFLQSPLSADYEILREFLPALGPEFLPEGGSNYGALLDASLQAFSTTGAADRFLVILSDGEATDEDWRGRIDELKKKGIRVLGLGVGTAAGAMIPDGTGQFVKDERGAVVMSKLESATLQELARATGGAYRDASAWVDLAALVGETIEAGRKGKFVETNTVRLVERFQWPLALGVWCLLVSLCHEFPVRPRPRTIALRATSDARNQKPEASKAAALLALFLLTSGLRPLASTARAAEAANAAPPPSASLAKVIGRLAGAEQRTARDWADLGRETLAWGGRLQTEQQAVPEGPVRDALAAAALGAKLDPKATDWPKLREELEALLKKPDDDKKDQDQNQQENQDQPQQQKDEQKKQDQKSEKQKKQDQKNQKQSSSSQDKNDPNQQPQDQNENPDNAPPPEQKQPGESAFGDMNKKEPPPPPPGTQKVGGTPDRKEDVRNPADPTLAQPLQKLEQLRAQDSPAQLFRLMEGERKKGPEKSGKNW